MNKANKMEGLAFKKGFQVIYHPPGTLDNRKSKCWEFKKNGRRLALYSSLDRCIEWLSATKK